MQTPIISVIVPIYNVEKYVDRCVDSLIEQTMEELEIILVDDGSSDNCPEICDSYADRDSRIRVIHKTNGGLSDARNAGIEIACGEFLLFVDGDDYVSNELCHDLLMLINRDHSDISVGGVQDVVEGKKPPKEKERREYCFSGEEALAEMLKGRILPGSACGKLFSRKLFKTHRFPVGKTYEDAFALPEVFLDAERVSVSTRAYYTYWHRAGSITTSEFTSAAMDIITAYEQTRELIQNRCRSILPEAEFRVYWAHFVVLDRMLAKGNEQSIPEFSEVTTFLRDNWIKIIKCPFFNKTRRIAALSLKIGILPYKAIWKLNEKRN